jgi:hypothetical protein
MRHALALAVALGMGIASMVPAAYASDRVDPAIYRNGHVVLQNAVPVYLASGSASSAVAGTTPTISDPYQELRDENYGR